MNDVLLPRLLSCSIYKARVIKTLTKRQRNRCYLCHRPMDDPRKSHWRADRFPTIDHMLPRSRGGTDDMENLAMSCRSCNLSKGNTLPPDLAWRSSAGAGLRGGLEVRA